MAAEVGLVVVVMEVEAAGMVGAEETMVAAVARKARARVEGMMVVAKVAMGSTAAP